jgi:hypothetical protein
MQEVESPAYFYTYDVQCICKFQMEKLSPLSPDHYSSLLLH